MSWIDDEAERACARERERMKNQPRRPVAQTPEYNDNTVNERIAAQLQDRALPSVIATRAKIDADAAAAAERSDHAA